ncbi:hypothetical protein B0I35DRAFT_410702 [Stachybotrys elegans]|uniref:Chromo domain-containing protein n=1 Tax=Stachybotrys elegans TaxID=80388 RepID=A0A8K0SLE9_9HYPO|nr:hypothetical protein B0I35DRAFT_410702 [Stachybotrys elegans]
MASVHTAQHSPGARDMTSSPVDPKSSAADSASLPRRDPGNFDDVYRSFFPSAMPSNDAVSSPARRNNTLSPVRPLSRLDAVAHEASPEPSLVARPRSVAPERSEEAAVSISVSVVAEKTTDGDEVEETTTTKIKTTTIETGPGLGSPVLSDREATTEPNHVVTEEAQTASPAPADDAPKEGRAQGKADDTDGDRPSEEDQVDQQTSKSDDQLPKIDQNAPQGDKDKDTKDSSKTDSESKKGPANPFKSDEIHEVDRIAAHRVNKETSTVDFKVEWVDAGTSWESERELQLQVPKLVLAYWDALGGRDKATGLEEYHVLRIIDSESTRPPTYRVQWVGYRATMADTTWESKELLERIAPASLRQFEAEKKKRGAKGKVGRPSKKAKLRDM